MIRSLKEQIAEQEKIVDDAQLKLVLLRRALRDCEPPSQNQKHESHLTRHINGQCCCDETTNIQRMLCEMMRVESVDVRSGTQAKSTRHEGVVKSILTRHGFRELYMHKSSSSRGNRLTRTQSNRVAQHVRSIDKTSDLTRAPLGIDPGMYFIHQPLGSQMPPDFVLINASPSGDKMLALECKSGTHIMWNDSLPKKNYVYLATDTRNNMTSLFTGDKDCLVELIGNETLDDFLHIDAHTHSLRIRYKHIQKREDNLIGVRSFPRSNFSSNHVPSHLRERLFLHACAKFDLFVEGGPRVNQQLFTRL